MDACGPENQKYSGYEEHRCLSASDLLEQQATAKGGDDLRQADCAVEQPEICSQMVST